jgi:FkbM family methyltransferase
MIDLFRATPLRPLFEAHPLRMIDIGARGGLDADLHPAAWAVDAVGFEPEPEAHAALEAGASGPWRSQRHLPVAIAGGTGSRMLYIPPDPASASLLAHDPAFGERFAMPHMFGPLREIPVDTITLDDAARRFAIGPVHHLKLDVEGAELDILQAAPEVLADVVSIKLEASFLPFRKAQPLAWDIAGWLYDRGFELTDILGPARWRKGPLAPHPFMARAPAGYSRGQIAQCDLLFFRGRDHLSRAEDRMAAFLSAACHGYFDLAATFLAGEERALVEQRFGLDLTAASGATAKRYGRIAVKGALVRQLRDLVPAFRSLLGGVPAPKGHS